MVISFGDDVEAGFGRQTGIGSGDFRHAPDSRNLKVAVKSRRTILWQGGYEQVYQTLMEGAGIRGSSMIAFYLVTLIGSSSQYAVIRISYSAITSS